VYCCLLTRRDHASAEDRPEPTSANRHRSWSRIRRRIRRASDASPTPWGSDIRALAKCLAIPLAVLLLGPSSAFATESDIQLWPSVAVNHGVGDSFGVHFMARARFDDDVSEIKDYLLRPFVSWRPIHSVTLDLGYDYLHSYTASSENRIWQAAQHQLEWRDFLVSNRIRLDERFVEDVDGVVVRFRYRFRTVHPLWSPNWYGVISDEVLVNVNDQGEGPVYGFEQNRLRFALGGRFWTRLRAEAGYEYQFVRSRSGTDSNIHTFVIEFSLDTGNAPLLPWVQY
jgi:hypothetical protein